MHRFVFVILAALNLPACSSSVGPRPDVPPEDDAGAREADGGPGDCGPCPAPGECRGGECLWPSIDGVPCARDAECAPGELCIAARCTPDCAAGGGGCPCADNDGCDNGFVCGREGQCVPDAGAGACVRDDECPDGEACVDGACQAGACGADQPYLAGTWDVRSELRLREALPGWLDALLAVTAEPFRFLAGQSDDLGIDIPILGALLEAVVREFADAFLPDWARDLMGALADLHDILSTMQVRQRWELEGAALDEYAGTATWTSFAFEYRGEDVEGSAEEVFGVEVSASPFEAHATCGVLYVDRHDVDAGFGAVIPWAIGAIVSDVTDGEYDGIADVLFDLEGAFCPGAAEAADALSQELGGPDVYAFVLGICEVMLGDRIDDALDAVDQALLELTVMRLQGRADITGADALSAGRWAGTLGGRDFTGDFTARRR